MNAGLFDDAEVMASYSRAQSIEDGVLIDVSETAKEARFKFPTAVTQAVWVKCVTLTAKAREMGCDEKGRLWDVVWMASRAIKMAARGGGDRVAFKVLVVGERRRPEPVKLWVRCGPGDTAEPVLTIMLEGED